MKTIFKLLLPSVAVLLQINALGATLYVDMQSPSPTMPYSSWATAAANIQDAIDAAVTGDVVLVTNGIYATGGKVMAGDLTNRVAIDKAITVQSVSGPSASIIQGAWDITTTNGPGAVRCVWLGDGGALIGFTTRGGATRGAVGGTTLTTGGGIWCNSSNARIVNCTVAGNAANSGGGGVYRGTLLNTLVQRNMAAINGAGTLFSSLVNCTVVENYAAGINTAGVYGTFTNVVRNSIVWGNVNSSGSGSIEYSGGVFTNTCTRPLPTGSGNISSDPLFDSDGFHLKSGSPCLGAGSSNFISGFDLDGQPYNSPPSMGCDERLLQPAVAQPAIVALGDGKVRLRVSPVGALVESFQWFKDGVALTDGLQLSGAQSSELALSSFAPTDAGFYQAIVTNSFGSATSAVVRISPRFVNASNGTPIPPFTNWASAATTIQDAVDVARSGDLIVVADGIYSSGGKVVSGDLTNRVVLTKALIVTSLNGTTNAIIAGLKDFGGNNGNGNGALRPVWMEHWTSLAGFTVRNGGTRTNGDNALLQSGGGIWGYGMGSSVRGCVITNNSASQNGGGAINVEIESSLLIQNSANRGGGVYGGRVGQSYLIQNKALPVIASGG